LPRSESLPKNFPTVTTFFVPFFGMAISATFPFRFELLHSLRAGNSIMLQVGGVIFFEAAEPSWPVASKKMELNTASSPFG